MTFQAGGLGRHRTEPHCSTRGTGQSGVYQAVAALQDKGQTVTVVSAMKGQWPFTQLLLASAVHVYSDGCRLEITLHPLPGDIWQCLEDVTARGLVCGWVGGSKGCFYVSGSVQESWPCEDPDHESLAYKERSLVTMDGRKFFFIVKTGFYFKF